MPRKRSTRVTSKRAQPRKPDGTVGSDLDPEEKRKRLKVFLEDFDIEVQQRLQRIEKDKIKMKSIIEKEIHLQINHLPPEIREMNIMDFIAAGGTVESALLKLEETNDDSFAEKEQQKTVRKKKVKGSQKASKSMKTEMAPPLALHKTTKRSKYQTPSTKQLPPVWDTPAITPKFDVNLPFTPGLARAPRQGERLMSLAGSPVEISAYKDKRTAKHAHIPEEEEEDSSILSRIAREVPRANNLNKADLNKLITLLSQTAK